MYTMHGMNPVIPDTVQWRKQKTNSMKQTMDADTALKKLQAGNEDCITNTWNPGNISPEIRLHTYENGQNPCAVVIACSDSRVIPEAVFSCGIGEIFTIRVAGLYHTHHGRVEWLL